MIKQIIVKYFKKKNKIILFNTLIFLIVEKNRYKKTAR